MKKRITYLFLLIPFISGCGFANLFSSSEPLSSESPISSEPSLESVSSKESNAVSSEEIISSEEIVSLSEDSTEISEDISEHEHSSSCEECSSEEHSISEEDISSESISSEIISTKEISINFLELGNYHTGDSTFIKAGDIDILIDAGSIQSSAKVIKEFVNQHCIDGKLEYVIATHAHQDHIAGFVGTKTYPGIFDSYKIGTLIDFTNTNKSTGALYLNYKSLLESKVESGDIEHHWTAAECVKEENGASKVYEISDGITMTILDQRFYYETTSDENNYSVCALFTQGDNNYLFTGDLEKDGEASLVANNTLPEVQLFKGGHHGSKTSNTDTLLSVIKPEVVCICCCAGNDEYTSNVDNQFPTQTAINNIAKYTDKIYVTTVTTDGHTGYTSMNGIITFYCEKGKEYIVAGSNNSIILKEQEWFKNNRTWPGEET